MIKEERQEGELKAEAKAEVIVNQRQMERDCGSCRGRGDYGGEAEREKQGGRGREGEAERERPNKASFTGR